MLTPSSIDAGPISPRTAAYLQDTKFRVFEGPFMKDQIEAVLYIERMASLTNVNISTWDILDVFSGAQAEGKLIVTDKRAINKRLYEFADLAKNGLPMALQGDQQKLAGIAEKIRKQALKQRADALRSAIDNTMRTADRSLTAYQDQMASAWQYKKELSALSGDKAPNLLEEITKICQAGFWTYTDFNEKDACISFVNVNPVVMVHKNARAKIDIRMNLGFYLAKLTFGSSSNLTLLPHKDNQRSEADYYHPYASGSGSICWGNASETARNHLMSSEYSEALSLLAALLTTYSPDSAPYASLESFRKAKENRENPQPRERMCEGCDWPARDCHCNDRCGLCEVYTRDCMCHTCSICEERYVEDDSCNCCHECQNLEGNCECCPECDYASGHASGCSEAPEPLSETSPF